MGEKEFLDSIVRSTHEEEIRFMKYIMSVVLIAILIMLWYLVIKPMWI